MNLSTLDKLLLSPSSYLFVSPDDHQAWTFLTKHFIDSLSTVDHVREPDALGTNPANFYIRSHGPEKRSHEMHIQDLTPRQIWEQGNRFLMTNSRKLRQSLSAANFTSKNVTNSSQYEPSLTNSASYENQHSAKDNELDEASMRPIRIEPDIEANGNDVNVHDTIHDPKEVDTHAEEQQELPGTSVNPAPETDHSGLDDGFFSIREFNALSSYYEKLDASGKTQEIDSDEDSPVDWDADPMTLNNAEDSDDFDDSEMLTTANQKIEQNLDGSTYSRNPAPNSTTTTGKIQEKDDYENEGKLEAEMSRAVGDVKHDLFDESKSDADSDVEGLEKGGGSASVSAYARERAQIEEEIRKLEAANVSRREWMLSGEAEATDRPSNSLVEEAVDFERTGKPVTTVTTELSTDIERLIKNRIILGDFDNVVRRYPYMNPDKHSSRTEYSLQDTKSSKGLGELYESDHLKKFGEDNSTPSHDHIEALSLWNELSSQLDALINWHYRPRPPQPRIDVVQNAATIEMEDVRPSVDGVAASQRLAPQEVYTPNDDRDRPGEVVLKSGASLSKEEMTREQKNKHRREKKKSHGRVQKSIMRKDTKSANERNVISDLKKGGVKIIGNTGTNH